MQIDLIKKALIDNNLNEMNKNIFEEFCDYFEIDELVKIDYINIDEEEGFLVLDKKLSYEIYFIGLDNMEADKLYLSINESKALEKFYEYIEAFK